MIEQRPGQKIFTVPGPGWGVRVIEPAAMEEYYRKVLGYGPIAYWPLWDALGSPTAEELVNSPAQDGAHTNVLLGQPGIGDGRTSGWYNGPAATSFTNVFTPVFQGAFDGAEGTAMIWARMAAGAWTDGAVRVGYMFAASIGFPRAYAQSAKWNINNRLTWRRYGNNVLEIVNLDGIATMDWMHLAMTWSESTPPTGEVRMYYNGVQTGITQVGLGAWAGPLLPQYAVIGAASTTPASCWHGWVQHATIFDYAVPPAGILDLATP